MVSLRGLDSAAGAAPRWRGGVEAGLMAVSIRPQAIPRAGEPAEVGFAVTYLCPDRAALVTGVALPAMVRRWAGPRVAAHPSRSAGP